MRAFVTGATGFVGSHLVRALVAQGHQVTAMVRDGKKAAVLPPEVDVLIGDLGEAGAIEHVSGVFDVVFHLGAAMSGDWRYHQRITVEGTRQLLEWAGKRSVKRFVLVSSLAVYDKSGRKATDRLTESAQVCGTLEHAGPYAWGKLQAERLLENLEDAPGAMEWVVARPGLIYGPGHLEFGHLGKKIGRWYLPFGGGSVRLPLVHIDSVTDALRRLAEVPGVHGRTFNILDQEQPSKRAYLRELSRCGREAGTMRRRIRCGGIPAWPLVMTARGIERLKQGGRAAWLPSISPKKIASRTVECYYDCYALKQATGWAPQHTLTEGLAAALKPLAVRAPVSVERVAIIGAGRMADFHLRALQQIPGVEVTGVMDRDLAAAQSLAERFGIPLAVDDLERLYVEARPQMVHILTPPASHASLALDAIERGCHVMIEKPMVVGVGEADRLIAAARDRGVTIGVDHNYTLDPRVAKARRMITSGSLGEVVHIDIFWGFDIRRFKHVLPAEGSQSTWAMNLPGGLLEDLMPHPLSLASALSNEEVHLHSWHVFRSGRHPYSCDDEARVMLKGSNCTIAINLTLSAKPDDLLVRVHGTRATVHMDVHNMTFSRMSLVKGPKAVARGICTVRGNLQPLVQTARNVVLLAMKRAEPPASVTHLVLEHYRSLREGRPLPADGREGQKVARVTRAIWPWNGNGAEKSQHPRRLSESRGGTGAEQASARIDTLDSVPELASGPRV